MMCRNTYTEDQCGTECRKTSYMGGTNRLKIDFFCEQNLENVDTV